MNPFEKRYTEELEQIELEGVVFHVKLPTSTNKRFQRSVIAKVVVQNDEGEFVTKDTKLDEMIAYQVDAFVRTCIRKVDGWPEYSIEALLAMPEACEDLWEAVSTLSKAKEEEANATAKKPVPTSNGLESGQEKQTSIASLESAAG